MTKDKKNINANHCSTIPKKIAFGISPLGFISIGIVPMGVISIGIVPMGIVSLGVVGMGILNASFVGMGIISAGITTMGIKEYSPNLSTHNHSINQVDKQKSLLYKSKEEAEKKALEIGCNGSHKMGSFWMPCEMK